MENTEYLSVTEWSAQHGKDPGNVRRLIQKGRIPAVKIGKQWAIPADAQPPADQRVKSGKYRDWREPREKRNNANSKAGRVKTRSALFFCPGCPEYSEK